MKAPFEFQTHEQYLGYLRTYFAALAMQGLCANSSVDVGLNTLANQAIQQADQLLKELEL